jgi:2,3-bisphosphoglycerate-dependent phosphoglycerate mutase
MNELYQGNLDASKAKKVLADLVKIREELKSHQPAEVVWDIDDPSASPPWGTNISSEITDLSNYFVTSTGRDVFEVLVECLTALSRKGGSMTIESY